MNKSILMLIILFLIPLPIKAQTVEQKGLSVAKKADGIDSGFRNFSADLEMILKNKHGQQSRRAIRILTKETEGDGDKTLSVFNSPKDVKGTAFLTYSHKVGDDDQWLYLPALKRVKRISSSNKSGSFMGSEFAYEDISSQELEKYTYKWLRDESYSGQDCFVIERYPVDKDNSGYSRQVVWIDKIEYRPLKINYYDRKNMLLKTFTASKFQKYLSRYWRAHEMNMINHQNGKSTRLCWSHYRFRIGLGDNNFNKNSLKRIR